MKTTDRIQQILRDFFDDETIVIGETTKAKDIEGWDSMANVQIMLSIEDEFGLEPFSIDELISFRCIGDIVKTINEKLGE